MAQHTNPVPVTLADIEREATELFRMAREGAAGPEEGGVHWVRQRLARLASTPADAPSGEGLHLPWTADPDDRPGYEWNWHVLDAKGDRVCFMANGPDSEAKVRHLVATANTLRTAADPEPAGAQEVVARPLEEWHDDHGDVVWWKFPIDEPAWIGSPLDLDWPGYHTHWTPHPDVPTLPQPPADEVK